MMASDAGRGVDLADVLAVLEGLGWRSMRSMPTPGARLGAHGVDRLLTYELLIHYEVRFGLSFPPDLVECLATFDDLLHYVNHKVADVQRA
jgi:acyl carrier protein